MSNIKKQNGLTMIELIVVMVILGVIGLSLNQYMINSVKAYVATKENISALSKIQMINKRMEQEIREADFNSIAAGFNTITLLFTNNDSTGANKTVKFEYDGTNNLLKMDYFDPAVTTLSNNITTFAFSYFKFDGTTPVIIGVDPASDIVFVTYTYDITENSVTYASNGRIMIRYKR